MMSKNKLTKFTKAFGLLLVLVVFTSSCIPSTNQTRSIAPTSSDNVSSDTSTDTEDSSTQLAETINFLQQGTQKYTSQINIFSDYNDSIILRGNEINDYLKEKVLTTPPTLCLISKYAGNSTTGSKEVLVMAARIRNYYNPDISGREYFLQVEVSNDSANTADCLTVNMNNTISQFYNSTSLAYKSDDVCPNCSTNTISEGLKLYTSDGSLVPEIDLSYLKIGIMPAVGSTGTGSISTCSSSSACVGLGYNCCLQGQCVNHGEVKSSVDTTSSDYLVAIQQILARPELIANYQEYFYICPTMVPTNPDNDQTDPGLDSVQQAADLFNEMQELYNCLNPVIDEFSICTKSEELVSEKLASTGEYTFYAPNDDITFSHLNAGLSYNNITGLNYAGIKIYESKLLSSDIETLLSPLDAVIGSANDTFETGQSINFKMDPPANAINDTLKIHYRVDGTCERVGSTIAKCKKFYKQGQSSSPPRSSDHPAGLSFQIPTYANTSLNIIVEVGGVTVSPGIDTWSLNGTTLVFSSNYQVYENQELVITYFVTDNIDQLMSSRELAQEEINSHCSCGEGIDCNLKPVYTDENGSLTLTSYACEYPQPDVPEAPLQQTVFMSARTVAHKFFDSNGVHYEFDEIGSDYTQECATSNDDSDESGCNLFEYENDDVNKPNNSSYTGFNEIYGSFNLSETAPMAATKIDVVKGRRYDLFTDEGVFSSCLNCGTSYYSNLQKIFPNNFLYKGGGYLPDLVESRREYNQGSFNADDFKFGRACFLPATMIPWTHTTKDNVTEQRRSRLKSQHFLFANGYNKDWYGFDYGSLIGSFDGVRWFSIGNQRQIQADSNKLYLAVNAYFGDVTANNTFKIVISEVSSVLYSGSEITHDTDSDGAECQRAHFCSTDNDCINQLGYDYSCQNVSGIATPWPKFDNDGNEISGSNIVNLLSLVGGSNGQVKRCVYRGRGSACNQDLSSITSANSYGQNDRMALHACSQNTYCESLNTSNFNTKIARYADSPSSQNNKTYITTKTDTVGLGARILGRPLNFYGNEAPPAGVKDNLAINNVTAMCIPGKSPEGSISKNDLNSVAAATPEADKILGIGRTYPSTISMNENYFNACPATNDEGFFTHLGAENLNDSSHMPFAVAQNMSTNSLNLPIFQSLNLFNDEDSIVTSKGYHKNTCLRAPGSKCFTDLDCSPNSFISSKIKTITNYLGQISEAEQDFWKEELVCGNSQERYIENTVIPNPLYDLTEQRCCRETGNDFTYYSQTHEDSDFDLADASGAPIVPGVNIDISSARRYSRAHTTYDKQTSPTESSRYPAMVVAKPRTDNPINYGSDLSKLLQYNTLHLNNSRMCCTGHWVRKFADGTNGNNGGHTFSGAKQQNIDVEDFKYLNWFENNNPPIITGGSIVPFYCTADNVDTADCEIKNIIVGSDEETKFLKWFGKLELLGIPQVLIETNDSSSTDDSYNMYLPLNSNQEIGTSVTDKVPFGNTIKPNDGTNGKTDVIINNVKYYSAASTGTSANNFEDSNFEIGSGKLKKIFSEKDFNCCLPTGIEVADTTSSDQCCSGLVTNEGGPTRCCLDDFTDLSVYTNRYVSSEGAFFNGQEVSDSDIDPYTGYIKKELVMEMAANMCCSGTAAYGLAISTLFIPLKDDTILTDKMTRRWIYKSSMDNAADVDGAYTHFQNGLKWNDHVYCIPSGYTSDSSSGDGTGTISE